MDKIKKYFSRTTSLILWAIILFLLIQRAPQWWALWQETDKSVATLTLTSTEQRVVSLPESGQKSALIFWATWCGPCTIELERINKAIQAGELPAERIHAISLQEDPSLVAAEATKRGYLFPVYADPSGLSLSQYKVFGTPTLYLINENSTVDYTTMGLSPLLIQRMKSFLK